MDKRENSRQEELLAFLSTITGHLKATSAQSAKSIQNLEENLVNILANENLLTVKDHFYSVENSDLFFSEAVPQTQLERMKTLVARSTKESKLADSRVFARDVPLRSFQIRGSVPNWANGAAVEKTLGPFQSVDGRKVWFDFYRIEKLVALYIDGDPYPAILFNVSLLKKVISGSLPPIVDPQKEFLLSPDSVWVASKFLAANAPPGVFTGLKIKQGKVVLSKLPAIVDGKLTISTNTSVKVTLDLSQPGPTDSDPTSPYGVDARHVKMVLPTVFSFHFSGNGGKIDSIVGNMSWAVFGQKNTFKWIKAGVPKFDTLLSRVLIPYNCVESTFEITKCASPFCRFSGSAKIDSSAWALHSAQIDFVKPAPAIGIGGIAVQCEKGLAAEWKGLKGGEANLTSPLILCDVGMLSLLDFHAGNIYCNQEYKLWKDEENPFGSSVKLQYTANFPLIYISNVNGTEALEVVADAKALLDRPVTVSGNKLDIQSKNTILLLSVAKTLKLVYLYDDNILFDNYNPQATQTSLPMPIALALHNALFKTTQANGLLLFGELDNDMVKLKKGSLFLTFGVYAYLPTLPDPYAANLGVLRRQLQRSLGSISYAEKSAAEKIFLWLVCQTEWETATSELDNVTTSFHFAPLQNQFQILLQSSNQSTPTKPISPVTVQAEVANNQFVNMLKVENVAVTATTAAEPAESAASTKAYKIAVDLPNYQKQWDERFSTLQDDVFALLDVSSNADQIGVSYAQFGISRMAMVETHKAVASDTNASAQQSSQFPLKIDGLDVTAQGSNARLFTLPQVSWEPVINRADPEKLGDPPTPFNYYPDDGGPTRLMNNSVRFVPLSPIPLSEFLVTTYAEEPDNVTAANFTLPFGLRSIAFLYKTNPTQTKKPDLQFNGPSFEGSIKGGIQLRLDAGDGLNPAQSETFRGYTLQMNNVLNTNGQLTSASTLGYDVCVIFNGEFFDPAKPMDYRKGVPLTRIDLSGYGESVFSNWINKDAQFASTSQAKFDVFTGRAAHEIIQVKSILYPWGIKVVRTITLLRVGSGFVFRTDSGWKAESDGKFDFRFKYFDPPELEDPNRTESPYDIHPGVIKGLFNVRNIHSAVTDVAPFLASMNVNNFFDLNNSDKVVLCNEDKTKEVNLQPVYFDADVEIEDVIQGQVAGRVPSSKILGFVQLLPRGIPLKPETFRDLLTRQLGSIGGTVDCILDIGKSGQKLRVNSFDVNNSTDKTNTSPVFVGAARGSVILPKDGSWSMVAHKNGTGDVTPLSESASVPLIRTGKLDEDLNIPVDDLLRIADPAELLRSAIDQTVNFGFLQSTNTQKFLLLTPAFQKQLDALTPGKLFSKTPPLFADAYRLISSKGIFPNIGNAIDNFGDAINLAKAFNETNIMDGATKVLELMHINAVDSVTRLAEDGYSLIKKIENFDLPSKDWYLINEDYLKVYVRYRAQTQDKDPNSKTDRKGLLDYNVNSFATEMKDKWKSRLNNLSMIVDLGPLQPLVTIKGNFDAKKGQEASYKGAENDEDFPSPQIEYGDDLKPIIYILQVLKELQGGNYADAIAAGLKIAMSNSADSWEYKFEASKEIPVVKFPPGELYNQSNQPLKLEASMKLGIYFNSAITTAALTDPKKLLPTAGAYMDFYGQLSVMCASIGGATLYATGQVNLKVAADTHKGPSLMMKFGFGAQIAVGLPVVGNASVLYMVGTEIYVDSTKLNISAFMLFSGHAELLGGLVGVTITIEAKGTISRTSDVEGTLLAAQVTFAVDISIFLVIDISFSESWEEERQIA